MRAALRKTAWIAGAASGLVVAAAGVVYAVTEARLARSYRIEVEDLVVPSDEASLARGQHLVRVLGQCTICHGDDLSGRMMGDDPWLGRLYSTNLTPGRGGLGDHTTADLVRSIRYGVKRDGTSVLMMPSQYYRSFTDADLAAIIAYLRVLPPVDLEVRGPWVGPLTRLVLLSGQAPDVLAAEWLDRQGAGGPAASPGPTADYGAYLVETGGCKVCHHQDLSGGRHPLALPGEPTPPDLRAGGPLLDWSEQDFIRTFRTGITPDGRSLDPRFMPWSSMGRMTDLELRAMWLYLRSLSPAPAS